MTSHDPREPLDADERELAGRLSRLGPVDGPSPALDARILAAAHAAAATRPQSTPHRPARRRWAAWAVPPAAITGVGVAAACVLALGVVWQMRPRVSMAPVAAESSEEVFIAAEPAGTRAPVDNPPPFEAAADAAATSAAAQPQMRPRVGDDYAQARKATADVEAAPAVAQESVAAAAPPAVAAPASDAFGYNGNVAANARADKALADDAFAADAPAGASTGAAAAIEEAAARQERRATYTSAARATGERGLRAPASPAAPAANAAPPPPAAAAPMREAIASPEEAEATGELDRVTVTGSRIAAPELAKIPARDDARLRREDWLVRIRARRDAGDLVAARESLRLFRRAYPQVRLPEDLRSLATDATP